MDAVIKVKVSELNASLLERLRTLFQGKEDTELTITYHSKANDYLVTLERSRKDMEEHNGIVTFTMEQLEEYTANNTK